MSLYFTWYEFKKDLERRICRSLLNSDWLKIKPRGPLPWDDSCMRSALLEVKRVQRQKDGYRSYRATNRVKIQPV